MFHSNLHCKMVRLIVSVIAFCAILARGTNSLPCTFFARYFCHFFYNCPDTFNPVCGSNGVTYNSLCLLERESCMKCYMTPRLEKSHSGRCGEPECDGSRFCTFIYKPVCGSDKKTYSNECAMKWASCQRPMGAAPVTYAYNGQCTSCVIPCPRIFSPVCGSDGKTYNNECLLRVENCKRAEKGLPAITEEYSGSCRASCDEIACIEIYSPVCASDGKTYGNKCEITIVNCRREESQMPLITVVHDGRCAPTTTTTTTTTTTPTNECPQFCTLQYDPRCGSDGKTYSNMCFLGIANCQRAAKGLPAITVVDFGVCRVITTMAPPSDCYALACLAVYDPVCGSDGNTYSSSCSLGTANCLALSSGLSPITEVSKGECI